MTMLSKIKVLDLTRMASGPVATQFLADMGAEVIKIERPAWGDDTRLAVPFLKDETGADTRDSAFFIAVNRGKKSVTVDISKPEGAALVCELATSCDVLVENYKAGGLRKYGLDYEAVRAINPAIVYCSITGFGQDGPYATRAAYDSTLQGYSGLMSSCGPAGGEPMRTAVVYVDQATASAATIAIMGALWHRRDTGEGQHIDCAMLDVAVALNCQIAQSYLVTGQLPQRNGNSHPMTAPADLLPTSDGSVIISCGNETQFRSLCAALDAGIDPEEPRFVTNATRLANRAVLLDMLRAEFSKHPSAHWVTVLEKAGVPCAPVNDFAQTFADPQVIHRDILVDMAHPSGRSVPSIRSPLRFSRTPVEHRPAPMLGQHTDDVLAVWLNKTPREIDALRQAAII